MTYEEGKKVVIEYIRQRFGDESYAEMWEGEEDFSDEEHEAGFWMWFNQVLDEASKL